MMNYTEMSDFDINCAVARVMGFEGMVFFDVDESICNGPVWNVKSGVTDNGIKVSRGNAFDPCSSWADAGPIIHNNLITITPLTSGKSWQAFCRAGEIEFRDKNPLRAAMIVFLIMQENKQ